MKQGENGDFLEETGKVCHLIDDKLLRVIAGGVLEKGCARDSRLG
jgi:hypothetical protein